MKIAVIGVGGLGGYLGVAARMKPSMQRDVKAGRPSELESMIGVIVRKGRNLYIPTPTADMLYASLLPGEIKARTAALYRRAHGVNVG